VSCLPGNSLQARPPPSTPPISVDQSLQVAVIKSLIVHLHAQLITASQFSWSWPASASRNSLIYSLQVRMIMASKYISKVAQSQPPAAFLSSFNHGLQVHLWGHSVTASIKVYLQPWSIIASKYFSMSTQAFSPGTLPIVLMSRLQPARSYVYK